MSSDLDSESLVKRTITLYNRTHTPSLTAKFISITLPYLVIQFSGVFCSGCGTFEITEGFAEQLKTLSGGKTELKQIKTTQITPRTIETTYTIKAK